MITTLLNLLSLTTCLQDQVVIPANPPPTALAPVTQPYAAPQPAQPQPYGPPPPAQPYTAAPAQPPPVYPLTAYSNPYNYPPPPPLTPPELAPRKSRFVFAAMPGLTFGVNAEMLPSLSASFFFGGRMRSDNWALGYQFTASPGFADRYWIGALSTRHHLTALTHFGERGFATIGGGLALFLFYPAVVELETRVGVRLGARKRAILGGQLRLGYNFFYKEGAPMPQLGVFFGFSFL